MGFAVPAHSASAQTTICGLTEYLIHHHGIPHSIVSNQQMKCRNVPMLMELTGLTMFRTILKLLAQPFKDSVTAPARWLGQGFPEGCVCSESASDTRCYFSHIQDSRSSTEKVEIRVAPFTITPSDPPAKLLLPDPAT